MMEIYLLSTVRYRIIDCFERCCCQICYGARGANGAATTTTKSGQNGEARVTFDAK